jgi:hypothetical protein
MIDDDNWIEDMAALGLAVIFIVIGTAAGGLLYWVLT